MIYPANCLVFYLLSSMVFPATVCQVYVSGSVGTEVVVLVETPNGVDEDRISRSFSASL
jgi:hypothetical protein